MQNLSSDLQQRASGIKLLILDVDGVLTDGRIFIRDNGRRNQIVPHFGRTRFENASGQRRANGDYYRPRCAFRRYPREAARYQLFFKGITTNVPPTPNYANRPVWRSMSAPLSATMLSICP